MAEDGVDGARNDAAVLVAVRAPYLRRGRCGCARSAANLCLAGGARKAVSGEGSRTMVNVLPAPVCPYVMIVPVRRRGAVTHAARPHVQGAASPLYPSSTACTMSCKHDSEA